MIYILELTSEFGTHKVSLGLTGNVCEIEWQLIAKSPLDLTYQSKTQSRSTLWATGDTVDTTEPALPLNINDYYL